MGVIDCIGIVCKVVGRGGVPPRRIGLVGFARGTIGRGRSFALDGGLRVVVESPSWSGVGPLYIGVGVVLEISPSHFVG